MEEFRFIPSGVCSREMIFKIENNTINDFEVVGGCPGNLQGIRNLIKGLNIDDVITKFSDIKCGMKDTSCPDQIAKALKEYKEKR